MEGKLIKNVECRNCGREQEINVRANGAPIFPFVCKFCFNPWFKEVQEVQACVGCGDEYFI